MKKGWVMMSVSLVAISNSMVCLAAAHAATSQALVVVNQPHTTAAAAGSTIPQATRLKQGSASTLNYLPSDMYPMIASFLTEEDSDNQDHTPKPTSLQQVLQHQIAHDQIDVASIARFLHNHDRHLIGKDFGNVFALKTFPNGTIASGTFEHAIDLWDSSRYKKIGRLEGHTHTVTTISSLPNGTVVSGSKDGTIKLWNVKEERCIGTLPHEKEVSALLVLSGYIISGSGVNEPDGKPVDGVLYLWNATDGSLLYKGTAEKNKHHAKISAIIEIMPNYCATASADGTIKLWELFPNRLKLIKTIKDQHNRSPLTSLIKLNNNVLVSGSEDHAIKAWDIENEKCVWSNHCSHTIKSLTALTNQSEFAAGFDNGEIAVFNLEDRRCSNTFKAHDDAVNALAITHDGRLISGSSDSIIRSWGPLALQHPDDLSDAMRHRPYSFYNLTVLSQFAEQYPQKGRAPIIKDWADRQGRTYADAYDELPDYVKRLCTPIFIETVDEDAL